MSGLRALWIGNNFLANLTDWVYFLSATWKGRFVSFQSCADYLVLTLRSFSDVLLFSEFLRRQTFLQMSQLSDLWVVDLYFSAARFQINYRFNSLRFNKSLILRLFLFDGQPVSSLTTLFFSSSWLEREAWDLFGVVFAGHNDLRRILTDYGFVGFPLRKDFPLSGFVECRYSLELSKVVSEPISLAQEFRVFQFLSPWVSLG